MTQTSTAEPNKRTAFFPGSFNPFTCGHDDIVRRALAIFDRLVIGVGINATKEAENKSVVADNIRKLYKNDSRISVIEYSGLTTEAAKSVGACAIVRGVRTVKDYEYERDMADINRQLSGIESVIFFSRPEYGAVSSSIVRELASFGVDISSFLPDTSEK